MSVIIFYNCQIDAIKIKGKGSCGKKHEKLFISKRKNDQGRQNFPGIFGRPSQTLWVKMAILAKRQKNNEANIIRHWLSGLYRKYYI